MAKHPTLSVVMPCYNESENIKKGVLEAASSYLTSQSLPYEVLIVDDGSTDASRRLIRTFIKTHPQFRLLTNKHQGKAKAVSTGVLESSGTYILFADFDQATPLSEIEKLLPFFDSFDIVIGSRHDQRQGAPLSRRIMARGFMLLRNIILGVGVADTQCGFKAFKKKAAHTLFKKLRLYRDLKEVSGSSVTAGFDVELLFLARQMGFSVKEVPVEWHYVETRRVSPLRDSWEGLRDLIRIKIHDIRGIYR